MKNPKISRLVSAYIVKNPSIKEALEIGIVNYSALARIICKALKINNQDAVIAGCRRYKSRFDRVSYDRKIHQLLKSAKIRVRNRMGAVVVDTPKSLDNIVALQKKIRSSRGDFSIIDGEEASIIITNDEYIPALKEIFKGSIKKTITGLAKVTMIFDEKIETTPGVVAFVYSLLASNNINIREEMSCWTDIMIMVDEGVVPRVLETLSYLD